MDEKEKQLEAFLEAVKAVESSGGKNVNHPVITKGVSKGDRAVGAYAMTPNTMREMLVRNPENPYSDLKNINLTELYQNERTIPEALKRSVHGVDGETARDLAKHALQKQDGNIEKALASWLMGHNLSSDKIGEVVERSPAAQDYVEKAMPVYEKNFPKLKKTLGR